MPTITGTDGNNTLDGTNGDDVILARGGADTIHAGGGNDVINLRSTPAGSDTIDGGTGTDVAIIDALYSNYTVTASGGSLVFTSNLNGTSETVTNLEQFAFDDQTIFIVGAGGYATIQAAVDAAPAGATILVAAGTYTEQLVVDGKSNLTIVAVPGANVTIHAPADVSATGLSSSGRAINAVVTVANSTNIVFSNIHVDGGGAGNTVDGSNANFVGVFYRNSTGGLDHVDITGVRDAYPGGTTVGGHPVVGGNQRGVGLQVDNDTSKAFFVHTGSITDFQKGGAVFNHADLDVSDLTVTGGGAQTINAQNGIQVLNSTGHITTSTITAIGYAGSADVYSGGILAYGNTNLDITNNTITGANNESSAAKVVGVYVFDAGPDNSGGSITGNTISYVDEGIDVSGGLGPNSIAINNNNITNIDQTDPYHAGVVFAPDGSTNDTISGSAQDDFLDGGAGNDTLSGLGGNDTLTGGTGNDTLNGDAGTDTAVYSGAISGYSYGVTYDANGVATGFTSVSSPGDTDTLSSIERLQFSDRTLDVTAAVQLRDGGGQLVGTFTTIQAAIDAAGNGATIRVAAGTYTEQLTVAGKTGLTISAVTGASVTVLAPATIAVNGNSDYYGDAVRAVIAVTGSTGVNINGITVDGHFSGDTTSGSNGDELTGIAYLNSTGAVDHVHVTHVGNSTSGGLFGLQHGSGLLVDNSGPSANNAVSFTNSTIDGFQKTGALIVGADITFTGNTVTGVGATGLTAQNGVQVAHSHGTFTGNTISGIGYTVPSGGDYYYSAGFIAYEPDGALAINNNTITGVGSAGEFTGLDLSDTAGIGVSFQNNTISSATNGVIAYTYTGDTLGLDANPNFTGTTFSGITGLGISFDPEESYGAAFHTNTAFSVAGTQFADVLAGSDGNDTFTAGDGNDVLEGRGGNDNLSGGVGSDSAKYDGPASNYTLTSTTDGNGFITGFTSVTDTTNGDVDTLSSIESLVFGNATFSVTDKVQIFDGGGTFRGSYASIQAAINASSDGYTIRVMAGTFAEALTVDKDVTIVGANHGIDGAATRGAETLISGGVSITASGVTFDGVKFSGEFTPGGAPFPVGVHITGNNTQIVDTLFAGTDNAVGILTGTVTGLDVGHTKFQGYAIGAYVSGPATTGSFHDNLFKGEWTSSSPDGFNSGLGNGVNSESSTLTVTHNTFTGLYAGSVQVLAFGPATLDVNTIVIDNTYTDNLPDRPVQIFPNGVITTVNGTDVAEAFNGDQVDPGRDFTFYGHGGNDRLFGADGNDFLDGGTGNDGLFGGGGIDTVHFSGAVTADNISFLADSDPYSAGNQAGWTVNGGAEGTDTLNGVEIVSSTTGRILLVGNTGFATIQAAVDAASNGDTILVAAGTYSEDVTISKGISILGVHHGDSGTAAGRDAATGVGESTIIGNWKITSAADVTINGLRFVNDATTTGGPSNPPISVLTGGTTGHSITDNIFWSTIVGGANGVDDRAIQISPIASGAVSITNNFISGTSHGMYSTAAWGRGIWSDGGGVAVTIDGNTFSWVRSDINLDMSGTTTATVSHNNFTNSGTGIAVGTDSDGLTVSHNTVTNVGDDFSFRNLTTDVTFNAATAIDTLTPVGNANDYVVILGGAGNDSLTGTAGADYIDGNNHPTLGGFADNDTLYGGGGNDLLYGRAGNDYLDGGTGDDTMDGGDGNDILVVDSDQDVVIGGAGVDEVRTTTSDYTLGTDVENLSAASGSNGLNGTGNALANTITGSAFDDTLIGLAGNDIIYGGAGSDTILGGNDNDSLFGQDGDDFLFGGGGNDTLTGGAGFDVLRGGTGNDTYYFDTRGDTIIENANEGIDTIIASVFKYRMDANIENLQVTFTGDFFGTGNNQDNVMTGNIGNDNFVGKAGNDTINGADGNDVLSGSDGADLLTGGNGADRFTYIFAQDSTSASMDRITDFHSSEGDKIDVSLIDAIDGGADDDFTFIGSTVFHNVAGELRTATSGGNTFVQGDTNGDGTADFVIRLDGIITLSNSDFVGTTTPPPAALQLEKDPGGTAEIGIQQPGHDDLIMLDTVLEIGGQSNGEWGMSSDSMPATVSMLPDNHYVVDGWAFHTI